jgi:hypothetical protein
MAVDFTTACEISAYQHMTGPFVSLKQPFTLNNIICSKNGKAVQNQNIAYLLHDFHLK